MTDTVNRERWELGGPFPLSLDHGLARYPWNEVPHSRWGSGRDALRSLVEQGRALFGWRRLLLPSYYCPTVPTALAGLIDTAVYEHAPTDARPPRVNSDEGDVVLASATFGASPSVHIDRGVPVIEDHSHDPASPQAFGSEAPYAFASLRKTLPLPDGGVAWSPVGMPVPSEIPSTIEHHQIVLAQLSAMALKRDYLAGAEVAKPAFLEPYYRSEEMIGTGAPSGMSDYSRVRLATLPVERWRQSQAENLAAFRSALGELPGVELLDFPFAIIITFRNASVRDRVRRSLIVQRIYSAVLWPVVDSGLTGIPGRHIELSGRLLMLPCDQRYSAPDMARAAHVTRAAYLAAEEFQFGHRSTPPAAVG